MTHESFPARRDAALRILEGTGIMRFNYLPPLVRGLWKLGVNVRPPHFLPFWPTALTYATAFGSVWGLTMWLATLGNLASTPGLLLPASISAGAFFGLSMASYYAYGRRKYKLPRWDQVERNAGPNTSVEARPNGKPAWPRAVQVYPPPRGQAALPSAPPHLER